MVEDADITKNYHKGNQSSVEAHESVQRNKDQQRSLVFDAIKKTGNRGLTSDEAEQLLRLRHQACSARFTELKAEGIIVFVERRATRSGRLAEAWRCRKAEDDGGF